MSSFRSPDLLERRNNAATVKKVMLEKFRAARQDPAFEQQRLKRIALNTLRKRFTKSGRARIVCQQHDVTRARQHEIIPAQSPVVAPHAMRPTMHYYEQRILLLLVKIWRQSNHVVNALTGFTGKPKVAERLPIYLRDRVGIK